MGGNHWIMGGIWMNKKSFFTGFIETRNFIFTTYAETETLALEQLKTAWDEHKENTGAWLDFEDFADDIRIRKITIPFTEIR